MRFESFNTDIEEIKIKETEEIPEKRNLEGLKNLDERQYNYSIFRLAVVKVVKPKIFDQELLKEMKRFESLHIPYSMDKITKDIADQCLNVEFIVPEMNKKYIEEIIRCEEVDLIENENRHSFK